MGKDEEMSLEWMLISLGIIGTGLAVITSPVWLPIKAYRSLADLRYKKDKKVINYPVHDDLMDLERRRELKRVGAPQWIRTNVNEINLNSGKTAVYSVILSDNVLSCDDSGHPKREFIQIEGYRLNSRKIKRFDKLESEKTTPEVMEKLKNRYNMDRFDHVECMSA